MDNKQPSDWRVRERATDPQYSFIVQAPAGSGKTELLTDRILALLATVGRPEEIVAITFTRKAAAEMHERVLEKLHRANDPLPPEAVHAKKSWTLARAALARDHALGWGLLSHPARLSIKTIDAFCASLVRNMPWLSSMGGVPTLVDDARLHYLEAARQTIDMVGESESVTRLLEHMDLDVTVTCEALADMLAQRDQWLPLLPSGDDRFVLEENFNDAVSQDLQGLSTLMPVGWAQQLAPMTRAAASELVQTYPDHPIVALLDWDGQNIGVEAENLDAWKGVAVLLLTTAGECRKSVNIKQGFSPKTLPKEQLIAWLRAQESAVPAAWIARLHAVVSTPEPVFTAEQWDILQAQLNCLRLAAAQLMLRFIEVGEVDFIEIARRADQALGRVEEPSDLLLKLDANIRHLLIDEFQDTSQSQISLIEKITAGWQQGDGRTLFLVGDPMQSIYRFRKADVVLFLQVRDHGLGSIQPECLTLTDNFRSQRGIVEWVNSTFSSMFPAQDDPSAGAIAYAHSTAFKDSTLSPAVCFHGLYPQAGERSQDTVLTLVQEALKNFPHAEHPVAILVRARSHLKDVTQLLAKEGIACHAVELVPLHMRAYVVDLVQIIRACVHPGDRAAWLSVLRSPYCGLRLDSLHALFGWDRRSAIPTLLERALRETNTGADASCQAKQILSKDEYQRLCAVAPILLSALSEDDSAPLAARMEQIWRALGGVELARHRSDLQDAESVFALIEKIAPYGGLDVDVLDARLTRLFASPETGARSVEVMTMHKAKGLQFETVILFGLHHQPVADRTPLVRIEQVAGQVMLGPIKARATDEQDVISKYLAQRDKRRSAFEVDRLLYVAATRAKQSLHLVAECQLEPKTGLPAAARAGSLLSRLRHVVEFPQLSADVQIVTKTDQTVPFFHLPRLTRIKERKARAYRTVVPSHSSYVWRAHAGNERLLGILVHGWLAHIGDQGLSHWTVDRISQQRTRIAQQCSQLGMTDGEGLVAATEIIETLSSMVTSARGQWLFSQPKARHEWGLLDESGQLSVLDYAFKDAQGWLVVDYKTSRPEPAETTDAFGQRMLSRHLPQLTRYCEKLSAFDGSPARAALYFPRDQLWFEYVPQVAI